MLTQAPPKKARTAPTPKAHQIAWFPPEGGERLCEPVSPRLQFGERRALRCAVLRNCRAKPISAAEGPIFGVDRGGEGLGGQAVPLRLQGWSARRGDHVRRGRHDLQEDGAGRGVAADTVAQISGHSARVGQTQDAFAAGIDLAAVMQAGGWRSPTMPARYGENLLARRSAERSSPLSRTGHEYGRQSSTRASRGHGSFLGSIPRTAFGSAALRCPAVAPTRCRFSKIANKATAPATARISLLLLTTT